MAPLIENAIEREAPVLVAVSPEKVSLLCEALGERSADVQFLNIRSLGSNPGRIIPAWRGFIDRYPAGPEPLGIVEPVWPERSAAELDECWRHEALLEIAFGTGHAWRLFCSYDLDGLPDHVVEAARMCHPHGLAKGGENPSRSDRRQLHPFDGALSEPPAQCGELVFTESELGEIRRSLTSWAGREGLGPEAIGDLVLAVDEIATNSVRHGGGTGRLQMWRERDALICEIRDLGEIRHPLLGRVRPGSEAVCGRGMWIVNQLCDLVQIRSSHVGSQIRLHKRLH
jgi:anti-sigma regulatory factor (Ser/Thr protein kinase)